MKHLAHLKLTEDFLFTNMFAVLLFVFLGVTFYEQLSLTNIFGILLLINCVLFCNIVRTVKNYGEASVRHLTILSYALAIGCWLFSFCSDKLIFIYPDFTNIDFNINISEIKATREFGVVKNVVCVMAKVGFLPILLILRKLFVTFIIKFKSGSEYHKRLLKNFIIYLIFATIMLLLTWPGFWSWDDLHVLYYTKNFGLLFWQNYLTDIYFIFGFMLVPSMGGFIFLQNCLIAMSVSYIVTNTGNIFNLKTKTYWLLLPFVVPAVIYMNLLPFRLALYSYIILTFFVWLFKLWKNQIVLSKFDWFLLCTYTAIIATWRSEGLLFLALVPLILFLMFRKQQKIYFLIGLCVISGVFLNSPQKILEHLDGNRYAVTGYIGFIDDLVKKEYTVNPESEELYALDKVINVMAFRTLLNGDHAFWNGLDGESGVRTEHTAEEFSDFKKAAVKLIFKHPTTYISERFTTFFQSCGFYKNISLQQRADRIYDPLILEDPNRIYDVFRDKVSGSQPLSKELRRNVIRIIISRNIVENDDTNFTQPIFYNIIPSLLGLMFGFVLGVVKKYKLLWLSCGSLIISFAAIFLVAPAQYFMYYFPYFLSGNFLIVLLLVQCFSKRKTTIL